MKINHMKKAVLGILVLSCFILGWTTFVRAEEGMEGKEKKWDKGKWEEKIKEVEKQLGVTPEQEQKLKENREKNRSQMETLRGQMKDKREAMRAELEKSDFNEAQVKAIHNDLKGLMSQMEDLRLDGILEVRKILTADQFKKFMEMKKDHQGFGKGERHWKHDKGDKRDEEDEK